MRNESDVERKIDESSSKPNVTYHILFQSKNRMDKFSSKTACVTTWKMKLSEKFLDESHDLLIRVKHANRNTILLV